jgi:hypothetical protein
LLTLVNAGRELALKSKYSSNYIPLKVAVPTVLTEVSAGTVMQNHLLFNQVKITAIPINIKNR